MCSQELLFLLVFEQLNRFIFCCCCCHENPTKSCSFPEVEMAFSLPEDTSESKGWPLPYFCRNIAAAFLSGHALCHQHPAGWHLPSKILEGWWLTGQQNVDIEQDFMAFYLST